MTSTVLQLRDALQVPARGPIDFRAVLGTSLAEALVRWRKGHFPMPRKVVQRLDFDDVQFPPGGDLAEVIDTRYQASHGVTFQHYKHTYDWATQVSGFEPAQGHYFGVDHPQWIEPHVYAVGDHGTAASRLSVSKPNAINVGGYSGLAPGQLLGNDDAIRINFDPPTGAVQIDSDYRISALDQGRPIWNWPQLLAYDADGCLLDQAEAPHGGTLAVSSWAGDIAYVMVTVNNHYAGVEPWGIFDNLAWISVEFVLRCLHKQRETPPPLPRSALVDQVIHRIGDVQLAQNRLRKRLAKVADAALAAQLQADLDDMAQQTEALMACYRRITRDPAPSGAAPARVPA